ncbi:hypothetical protein ES703_91434 [subsurface metagenome]
MPLAIISPMVARPYLAIFRLSPWPDHSARLVSTRAVTGIRKELAKIGSISLKTSFIRLNDSVQHSPAAVPYSNHFLPPTRRGAGSDLVPVRVKATRLMPPIISTAPKPRAQVTSSPKKEAAIAMVKIIWAPLTSGNTLEAAVRLRVFMYRVSPKATPIIPDPTIRPIRCSGR